MFDLIRKQLAGGNSGSKFSDDLYWFLHILNVNIRRLESDKSYFTKAYIKTHGEKPNFENPTTFDEKQLWLKMNYRNPLCTQCSDKYLVREYVSKCGYEHILNHLIAVYDDVSDIQWEVLPDRFYMKANHTSGCNVRCNSKATFDRDKAIRKLKRGMSHDYSLDSKEWNYKDIKRKIIVEDIIESKNGQPLVDYRFLCGYGKCDYLFIDINTASENGAHRHDAKRNVYDKHMNLVNVTAQRQNFSPELVSKPCNFDEMLQIAQKLSAPFPFCRVDLYNVDGKIIFGEITFFHAGGLCSITPKEWEFKLGEIIDLRNI